MEPGLEVTDTGRAGPVHQHVRDVPEVGGTLIDHAVAEPALGHLVRVPVDRVGIAQDRGQELHPLGADRLELPLREALSDGHIHHVLRRKIHELITVATSASSARSCTSIRKLTISISPARLPSLRTTSVKPPDIR